MTPPELCNGCSKRVSREETIRQHEARRSESVPDVVSTLAAAGVNVDAFHGATLTSFRDDWEPEAMETARAYLEEVTSRRRNRPWAYLHGPTGNGKTMLAVAMLRHLITEGEIRPDRAKFVNAEILLLRIEESYDKGDGDSAYQLMRRFADYELLVVDDLGVRGFGRDHPRRIFYLLADKRAGRPTIWTSNLSLSDLEQENPEMDRIVSRILGECGSGGKFIQEFSGPDRRARRAMSS